MARRSGDPKPRPCFGEPVLVERLTNSHHESALGKHDFAVQNHKLVHNASCAAVFIDKAVVMLNMVLKGLVFQIGVSAKNTDI